jgi:hypothetical protein
MGVAWGGCKISQFKIQVGPRSKNYCGRQKIVVCTISGDDFFDLFGCHGGRNGFQ